MSGTGVAATEPRLRYEVVTVTGESGFRALRDEWDRLVTLCSYATPFQTFEWQWSWWSRRGDGRRLLIVTIRLTGDELIAIAPFMISAKHGLRVLEFLGTGLSDYLDVIAARHQDDVLELITEALLGTPGWDVACLQTPESAIANPTTIRRLTRGRVHHVYDRVYEIAPYLAITGSWDDFVRGRKKKFRYSLRERTARFNAAEGTSVQSLTGQQVTSHLVAAMWEVEQRSWKARAGTAMLRSPEVREFYGAILESFGQRGWVNVRLAFIGDRPIAYVLAFRYAARTYLYALSFDDEFSKLAPGMLLLQDSIREAFETHAVEYDFLCGDESYKQRWTSDQRRVIQTVVVRPTVRARVGAFFAYQLRWALARSERLRATRLRLIGWWSRRSGSAENSTAGESTSSSSSSKGPPSGPEGNTE